MALETWLIKVKTALSNGLGTVRTTTTSTTKMPKRSHVGVLAFEIAGIMTKIIHLWQSLSDKNIAHLRHEAISLEGVRKIVSNDDAFLLGLACAELVENLRIVADSISRLCHSCSDPNLHCFDRFFKEFAELGRDPHGWVLSWKEMEAKQRKMDRYVTLTASLYREMDELSEIEHGLKKLIQCTTDHEQLIKDKKICDLQQKLFRQKQEVKHLKDTCLWSRSFDMVTSLLGRSVFTILARIKLVFGISSQGCIGTLPRSLSVSAAVYPSENSITFVSGPLRMTNNEEKQNHDHTTTTTTTTTTNFFESNSKILKPPPSTLGAVALGQHYANLIIVIEKMIRSPQLVGPDARDDVYAMLPTSIRASLRTRLRGVGFSATDSVLAAEWRDALGKILGWLSPLAHNMIKWQSERSFEQQNLTPKTNVLLLQTLYFANQAKTEAAITELLVGLNYIWRYEREMNVKAWLECCNFNGQLKSAEKSS